MNSAFHAVHDEIRQTGALTFARFMEVALYHPEHGYYERSPASIGRRGDYATSVSVGPLLGELLEFQFRDWLSPTGSAPGLIVEAGAHDGRLALDILRAGSRDSRPSESPWEYWILEPSPRRQAWQRETLQAFADQVRWFDSWEAMPKSGLYGVVFANELLDSFPAHRLGWDARSLTWFEWGLHLDGDELAWTRLPLAASRSAASLTETVEGVSPPDLPDELLGVLPDGFTTEVCPAATQWWQSAAKALRGGRLLTLDYGLPQLEFFSPERFQGTLHAYRRHQVSNEVLSHVGEQDITGLVNFTALEQAGENAGLVTTEFATQAQFLMRILARRERRQIGLNHWSPSQKRQLLTLIHPDHFGQALHVLVQERTSTQAIPRVALDKHR